MANKNAVPPYTARGRVEGENWQAVADVLNARMAARRIGQQALATASGVSVATLRQVQHGTHARRVQNATLTAIARALGWPDDHLIRVLLGDQPSLEASPPVGTDRMVVARLDALEGDLRRMNERLSVIERHLGVFDS
ncbi:helix-turn-helix transcriptional regulator [Frankia sp. Cppng1_Ct_nod]|uniref:helix-turn-helix domain-containing protein n=1 Tax=Frankia sp. Cppng1_Ct_nod TaxID=2897162 RepID=UPI00104120BA|nr:helix-turn-helix transcriptional regulator [Frankia sp. Cppng1_Ct_nod]